MPRLIAVLAVASGMCGIAYELLYARLLTTWLGDMFHVAAAILAAFLLGIAAGSRVAHRFVRWLWLVEIGIGAYALAIAAAFALAGRALQEAWVPAVSSSPASLIALVFALLLTPALLIGFSVPSFALLLRVHARGGEVDAFRAVYRLYNVGAAACVLAVEFVVLRQLGLTRSLLVLAAVNLAAGLALLLVPGLRPRQAAPSPFPTSAARRPALTALFAVSVLSGIYQMFLYKLAEMIFGPFHENFALVLALVLLGIAAGTSLAARRNGGLADWLVSGSGVMAACFLAVAPLTMLWALLNGTLGVVPWISTGLKTGILALMSAGPLLVFGGTIPALLAELPEDRSQAGRALAISGLGNCVGYLAMVLWLYAALPDAAIACAIAGGLLVIGAALLRAEGSPLPRTAGVAAALVAALALFWPGTFLHYGYDSYASWNALRSARNLFSDLDVHRRFASQISLLRDASGNETVILNGYTSLVSSRGGRTNLREMLYGLTPALYSARHERALVLGVGTGITAAATATVYDDTTAVEVDPSMLALLPRFAAHNLSLAEDPTVDLVLDDGLSALLRSSQRFDAIVNTVTSPLYFSSSKLYTRDFFRLVSERLAPGGVYALWFDGRVTEDGARVVFRTLRESFGDCTVTYLDTTYLQLVCANDPLKTHAPGAVAWDAEIASRVAAHGLGLPLDDLLRALALRGHRLFDIDWRAPANTTDRPVLEFLMASRAVSHQDWWSPYALLEVDPSVGADGEPLSPGSRAERCFALRALAYAHTRDCLAPLAAPERAAYAARIADYERAEGPLLPPLERLSLARVLIAEGQLDTAESLLASAAIAPRHRGALLTLRARIALARGEPVGDEMLARLFTAAPLDPLAREVIALALAARGERVQALAHVRFLSQIGIPSPAIQDLSRRLGADALAQRSARP